MALADLDRLAGAADTHGGKAAGLAADVKAMYDAGADYVYLSRFDSAVHLVAALEAALAGTLGAFKDGQLHRFGALGARAEVLP